MGDLWRRLFGRSTGSAGRAFGATDVGRRRENNEDAFAIMADQQILIVADGVGGHNAGEVASQEAIRALEAYFGAAAIEEMRGDGAKAREHLQSALRAANRRVVELAQADPSKNGMGCALAVAFVNRRLLHTCHVGDVRCYLSRRSGMVRVTNDHSQVAELVRRGYITEEEARKSKRRNVLTRAIGSEADLDPEYASIRLEQGDRVVLCSDGLWDMLTDEEMWNIVKNGSKLDQVCRDLIERANGAGGKDNITVVVYEE